MADGTLFKFSELDGQEKIRGNDGFVWWVAFWSALAFRHCLYILAWSNDTLVIWIMVGMVFHYLMLFVALL